MAIQPSTNPSSFREAHKISQDMSYSDYKTNELLSTDEVPLVEKVWRLVIDNKWVILGILGSSIILALVATLLATPQYTATSRVEISRQQANVVDVEGVEDSDRSSDVEFYDTQYALMEARAIALRVARNQNLISNEQFFEMFDAEIDNGLFSSGDGQPMNARARQDRLKVAIELLQENVAIFPIRGSSLVDVSFTSPDPGLSAEIANAWVEQFIESNLSRRFASTKDARDFLEGRLQDLREKLEASERQLVEYASQNEIIAISRNQNGQGETASTQTLATSELQEYNAQLTQARAERIAAESALKQSQGLRDSLANPAINALRQKRAEVAGERAKQLAVFEADYPVVQGLTSEIEQLDQSIATEEARVIRAAATDLAEARQRERQLLRQVDLLKDRFAVENRNSIEYNIYQREVDTNRELYNGLLQRYKEIGVAGVGANNVSVVDEAEVPDRPSSPRLLLNLLFGAVIGAMLSAAYVFIREQIDQSLRDPAAVGRALGLAHLGTIPDLGKEDLIEGLADGKSVASEAYFSAGTNLSFLTSTGVPASLLLTSTLPNEGKSTSAYGIALTLARMGRGVILIDADMRNPSVHHIFGTEKDVGLSSYMTGDDNIDQMIFSSGERHKVDVLPAGPIPPNPAELLTSNRFADLIAKLEAQYEHVVVDGPPMLGIADAPLLAKSVTGVIYTVEANRAKIRSIRIAIDRLRASHANIFGALITKVDMRNNSYGYGDEYGYGYSYGGAQ